MDDVILLIVGLMFYSIVAYYGTTFKIYWDASLGVKRSIKGYKKYWKDING